MADTDAERDGEQDDSHLLSSFSTRTFILVGVLSLIAVAPLSSFTLNLELVFAHKVNALLHTVLPLFLLLPLPIAYVTIISRDRFRWESLGTLFPLVYADTAVIAVTGGLVLGSLLTSYKTRSTYKGDNAFWTSYRSAKSAVFALAIVIAFMTMSFYNTTPEFRQDIQGNLTDQSVDVALEYAGIAANQSAVPESQQTAISGMATMLAENVSLATVLATEQIVFTGVNQSGQFDDTERSILRAGFDTAENRIPSTLRDRAGSQIENQLQQSQASPQEMNMEKMVRPKVASVLEAFSEPSSSTSAILFIITFSLVMLFKLPFGLIGAVYAAVLNVTLARIP